MSIDRDDGEERQIRLDWMIDEFRKAQTRRLVKTNDKSEEPQGESDRKAAGTGPATSP